MQYMDEYDYGYLLKINNAYSMKHTYKARNGSSNLPMKCGFMLLN